MIKLFVGLLFVWSSYTASLIIGSIVTNLMGIPTTFTSIWCVMLILVISSFIAGAISVKVEDQPKKPDEEDHSERLNKND